MSTNFKTSFNIIQDYANNLIIINATSIIINITKLLIITKYHYKEENIQ